MLIWIYEFRPPNPFLPYVAPHVFPDLTFDSCVFSCLLVCSALSDRNGRGRGGAGAAVRAGEPADDEASAARLWRVQGALPDERGEQRRLRGARAPIVAADPRGVFAAVRVAPARGGQGERSAAGEQWDTLTHTPYPTCTPPPSTPHVPPRPHLEPAPTPPTPTRRAATCTRTRTCAG